jgi:hypothetical protein
MSTVFLSNLNFSIISTTPTSTLHRCFAECFHPSKAKAIQQSDSSCTYVGIVTVVYYLHSCSFASSIYPCSPLLLDTLRLRSPSFLRSLVFHFGNNQLRLLLEFIFGFKLKTALVPSIVKLPTTKFSIHFQYHPTWTSIAELPAPEFSIHFHYLQV